jgi:c-di-GMP-binding flagellar brake protein YcgR
MHRPSKNVKKDSPTLAIGQRLTLEIGGAWYASRLEDSAPDALCVAWPSDAERNLIRLRAGDRLTVSCSADALYFGECAVVAAQPTPVPLLRVQPVGEWQRSQRRGAVRADVAIRPRVADRITAGTRTPLRAGIVNLSAVGLRLRSHDELRPDDLIELAFELMGISGELELTARVERVERVDPSDQRGVPVWEAGCALVNPASRVTEQIVQFIFAQQRALARARRT